MRASGFQLQARVVLASIVLAALVASPSAGSLSRRNSGQPQTCTSAWATVATPDVESGDVLLGIVAPAAGDIWAVGSYEHNHNVSRTLAEHWNGTSWGITPTPNPGNGDDLLNTIASPAAGQLVAVGTATEAKQSQTLIERWSGTSWTIEPGVPSPGTPGNHLYGVAASSPADIWAVGDSDGADGETHTLILHYDGTSWNITPGPSTGSGSSYLRSVAVVARSNAWAVGEYSNGGALQTLIEHWNGTAWKIKPSPNVDVGNNILLAISAAASDDIWAIGEVSTPTALRPLAEHWNGTSWTVVRTPTPGIDDGRLYGVSAAPGTAWAVGSFFAAQAQENRPLIMHWDGTAWTTSAAGDVGAAGGHSGHTMIERRC